MNPHLTLMQSDEERLAWYRSPAFRHRHPDVIILLKGPAPKAWVGREAYECGSLRSLLDVLDEMFGPAPPGG